MQKSIILLISIFHDAVSKQKALEQRIVNVSQFFEKILSNVSDSVFMTDGNGVVSFICTNVYKLFGRNRFQKKAKRSIYDLIEGLSVYRESIVYGENLHNVECAVADEKSSRRHVLVNVITVSIDKHTRLFVCRDITDYKQAQTEIKHKNIAMDEVIASVEREKALVSAAVRQKVDKIILPLIDMISDRPQCKDLAMILRSAIKLLSPHTRIIDKLVDFNLSAREIQICDMIRIGMTIKDIARILNTSPLTVETQRKTIRKKLGIADGSTNLSTNLKKMSI